MALALSLNLQRSRLLLSGRVALDEPPGGGCSGCPPNAEVGVLGGVASLPGTGAHFSASAGLARRENAVGGFLAIPLQVEMNFRPASFIGVGLVLMASLGITAPERDPNTLYRSDDRSFAAVGIALQLGWLR